MDTGVRRPLTERAYRIRRYALQMGELQGQGYIGQALGHADVLAVACGHAMNFRPGEPEWEGRDRFLLWHGHYAIALYAALAATALQSFLGASGAGHGSRDAAAVALFYESFASPKPAG